MSDIFRPESATASFTAVSACAASGISAERVTLENPTPLTATLHRFSHIRASSLSRGGAAEAELRQGDVLIEFLEHDLYAPPDFRLCIFSIEQIARHQGTGRVVELDDDAGVGHCGREALVPGVVHDGVGVDRSGAAHQLEFEVRRDALSTGCVGRVLEMSAALAALQFQDAPCGRVPEW